MRQTDQVTPSTVEADGYTETNILLTTSVYVEFFHNKKAFLREQMLKMHYNFVVPRKWIIRQVFFHLILHLKNKIQKKNKIKIRLIIQVELTC